MNYKTITIIIVLVIFTAVVANTTARGGGVDERTKELCRIYAARDHEKEIAPERYKLLGKKFIDTYDWYGSCLNHVRYPVVEAR